MGLQHQPGGKVERAIGMEATALLFNRHMGVNRAFEVALLELAEPVLDMLAQVHCRHRGSYP
jgi:hypothetical protein